MNEAERPHFGISHGTGICRCPECRSLSVYPTGVELFTEHRKWLVDLICPNCFFERTEAVESDTGRLIDQEFQRRKRTLISLDKAHLGQEMNRFCRTFELALEADVIQPDDFNPVSS